MKDDDEKNKEKVTNLQNWKDNKESCNLNDPAFGERLKRYIAEADLTPSKLADEIGASSAIIDLYIEGQIPSALELHKIAQTLAVPMEELLDGKIEINHYAGIAFEHIAKKLRNRRRAEKVNALIDKKWVKNLKWYITVAITAFVAWIVVLYSNLPLIAKVLLGNVLCYGIFMGCLMLIFFRRVWIARIVRTIANMLEF
jgi:transcriptional regulator with XRE-family HTH domain